MKTYVKAVLGLIVIIWALYVGMWLLRGYSITDAVKKGFGIDRPLH